MSSEVPIEIENKPTAVSIMHELVEHLQDTIEALKREIVRNPKSDEYRKALKGTEARLTIAQQNPGARRGKNIALTIRLQYNHPAKSCSGRFEPLTTVYDPKLTCRSSQSPVVNRLHFPPMSLAIDFNLARS